MEDDMSQIKCIVVGAGATGSMVSCFLKRIYGENISLQVWDKSHGIGGRMTTHRYSPNSSLSVDIGAQYISASKEYKVKHKTLYDELENNAIIVPLTATIEGMQTAEDTKHYVATNGISTIPKYFLRESGATLKFQTHLNGINISNSVLTGDASVSNSDSNTQESADAIVLTIPIHQILSLGGDMCSLLEPFKVKMQAVSYSSRYALGLFYPNLTQIDGVGWASKYTPNNPCLCFISIDTDKRQKDSSGGVSIMAHASVPFSIEHFDESFDNIEQIMLGYLAKEIPGLPNADKTKVHKWRYSQVSKAYDGSPGCIVLNQLPLVICAGDAFIHSNFDGCADSAFSVAECFKKHFSI